MYDKKRRSASFCGKKRALFEKFNYTCQVCDYSISEDIKEFDELYPIEEFDFSDKYRQKYYDARSVLLSRMQIHHITPLRSSGSHHWTNLIPLCERCHTIINSVDNLLVHKHSNLELENRDNSPIQKALSKAKVIIFGNIFGDFVLSKNKKAKKLDKESISISDNEGFLYEEE